VSGTLANEDISIGDVGKVISRNQTFLMAHNVVGFNGLEADGFVGLGIKSKDPNHLTLVENLYQKNVIKNNIFSIFLNNNKYEKDDKRKPKSMLMIGGTDLDKYSNGDDVNYYQISSRNDKLWSLNMSSIKCKDTEIETDETFAVLDSNNPKIIGPKAKVDKLFERFEAMYGCGYYYSRMVCDCSEIYAIVKFPHITIKIEDDEYTFHEGNYFKKTSKVCFLMFEGADIDYWILGQPFLRKYYSIYDIKNERIGLVEAASSRFTVDTDSNWWIIPVVLLIGGAIILFFSLGWTYYKKYSSEKLLIEQEARG
jgi:hypothetical protein